MEEEELNRAKIRSIKSKVMAMLEERQALESGRRPVVFPSQYWSDCCSYFDYLFGLPEEYFAKLRVHTYHLTTDNCQTYYWGDPEEFKASANLDALTKDIPSEYILNEPKGGIGFHFDGDRFVSHDILRYQRAVNTLYRYRVFSELSRADHQRVYVLEVGAGYGGLAHHLSGICNNVTYIIVDLPETLLFSACYLSLLNPQKNIYIYDKSDYCEFKPPEAFDTYDLVLLPNYQLASLAQLRFDLVINVCSLMEMTTGQAETYLDFIGETCRGVFYSYNQERHPRNKELTNLSDLFKQRFDLIEVPDWQQDGVRGRFLTRKRLELTLRRILKRIAILVGLLDRPKKNSDVNLPYREYICTPLLPSKDSEGMREQGLT